jgi:cytoskeleton protein RodZ
VQGSLIGVGPALRKARERRRVTVDEASRGTKLRADVLEALEDERFDALLGEVYVRGALRTYAGYLGLDPDRVLAAYSSAAGVEAPPLPEPPNQIRRAIGAARRRDNHLLAAIVVVVLVVAAAGFGLLSSRNSSPSSATLPVSGSPATSARNVIVGVAASRRVDANVISDGVEQPAVTLQAGETRTFQAEEFLTIKLSPGGLASVTVNGSEFGTVGSTKRPWEETFSPTSIADPTP